MPPDLLPNRCPICLKNTEESAHQDFKSKDYSVKCAVCGSYTITEELCDDIYELLGGLRPYLTAATRQASEAKRPLTLGTENWREYAEAHAHSSLYAKTDKLIRLIESQTNDPGDYVRVNAESDYPLVDAPKAEQFVYLLEYAHQIGLVEFHGGNQSSIPRLTFKGWAYLDPSSAGAGRPGHVFVAMSFDTSLNEAFDLGIKPAIETDCQLAKAERIDKVHHNEKICDKILSETRRCQFMVADYTQHKGGVYFEDGFALGLGREVIRCCRDDDFEHHFDTRQYPHIKWSRPADLRSQLAVKIQALGFAGQKRP